MRPLVPFVLALFLHACSSSGTESLCKQFFTPYPDHVSQLDPNPINKDFVAAMQHYAAGDYEAAIPELQAVVDHNMRNSAARLYLVNALLAEGKPYKAEMHLDFMENYKDRHFSDQVEWYNALCWLCEGDAQRAALQAEWIASRPHTYQQEARDLAKALAQNPR